MKILTELQQNILDLFFSVKEFKKHFYLTGGTALSAFYLKHRLSDDLDFFTHSLDLDSIDKEFEALLNKKKYPFMKERSSPTFRRYRINKELQVDLVRDIDFRVGVPELVEKFMIDNPKNIAVNKITAIYGRLDPKDYVDLYFLQKDLAFDIMELLNLAKMKDAGLEFFQWSKIIADVDSFTVLPNMLRPLQLQDLKNFFHQLREKILKAIKPD